LSVAKCYHLLKKKARVSNLLQYYTLIVLAIVLDPSPAQPPYHAGMESCVGVGLLKVIITCSG
jgi:hypothetical protein